MTQQQAFELIKQAVKECKGNLHAIFICVSLNIYLHDNGEEEIDFDISVRRNGEDICRTKSVEEAIIQIKSFYGIPYTTITPNGELPNLAS